MSLWIHYILFPHESVHRYWVVSTFQQLRMMSWTCCTNFFVCTYVDSFIRALNHIKCVHTMGMLVWVKYWLRCADGGLCRVMEEPALPSGCEANGCSWRWHHSPGGGSVTDIPPRYDTGDIAVLLNSCGLSWPEDSPLMRRMEFQKTAKSAEMSASIFIIWEGELINCGLSLQFPSISLRWILEWFTHSLARPQDSFETESAFTELRIQ